MSGSQNSKISWIKFSDLACPYCQQFYNSNLANNLKITYGDKINSYFILFPLDIHPTSYDASLLAECFGEQKGTTGFFELVGKIYKEGKTDKDFILNTVVSLGADKQKLEQCFSDKIYASKLDTQINLAKSLFSITGTPTSVFVNNETGEYEIMIGMYEYNKITSMIDNLIK